MRYAALRCAGVVLLLAVWAMPVTVSAQSDVLDGWFQCFTHYESGMELLDSDVIYYPSIFAPGGAFLVPYSENTFGTFANWICTPFTDGYLTLGVDLDNAVGSLKTTKAFSIVVPPEDVVGWVFDCAWQAATTGTSNTSQVKVNGGAWVDVSPTVGQISSGANSYAGNPTVTVGALGLTGTAKANWDAIVPVFPSVPSSSASSMNTFYLFSSSNAGHAEINSAHNEIACSLQQVLEYDGVTTIEYDRPEEGWDYVPPTPTSTPGDPWESSGWATPVPWIHEVAGGEIGVTETGISSCFDLLPGFSFDETVFGYEIEVGWDAFSLCMEGNYLNLVFYDWNMGALATALVSLGGFAVLYRWIRLG